MFKNLRFYLGSLILHGLLLALILFQVRQTRPIPQPLETQVVFEQSVAEQATPPKGVGRSREGNPKQESQPKQVNKQIATKNIPQREGFLRANRLMEKDEQQREQENTSNLATKEKLARPEAAAKGDTVEEESAQTGNTAGSLKQFSKNWKTKNEQRAYKAVLARLVGANWILPPVAKKDFLILIETFLDPRGNIVHLRFVKSSGLAVLDGAAERAIRVSVPFPEFPTSFGPDKKSFRVVFRFTPDKISKSL